MSEQLGLSDQRIPSRNRGRVGAFFDMDKTLISENSGSAYIKHRYAVGEIGRREVARGLAAYLRYKVGALDILAWTKSMLVELAGRDVEAVRAEARALFESAIVPTIYPEAVERIREHQKLGHAVCIVSGATDLVVEPLAERLGVEHAIYTQLEVAEGRYTGRVIEPICFEEGKVHWLRGFIEAERIDLSRSYFYTDSVTDRALLDLVGHPQVVNPDPLLYRLAVRRRWPVCFYDGEGDERTGRERALV